MRGTRAANRLPPAQTTGTRRRKSTRHTKTATNIGSSRSFYRLSMGALRGLSHIRRCGAAADNAICGAKTIVSRALRFRKWKSSAAISLASKTIPWHDTNTSLPRFDTWTCHGTRQGFRVPPVPRTNVAGRSSTQKLPVFVGTYAFCCKQARFWEQHSSEGTQYEDAAGYSRRA